VSSRKNVRVDTQFQDTRRTLYVSLSGSCVGRSVPVSGVHRPVLRTLLVQYREDIPLLCSACPPARSRQRQDADERQAATPRGIAGRGARQYPAGGRSAGHETQAMHTLPLLLP
jgi:hypothetical protein